MNLDILIEDYGKEVLCSKKYLDEFRWQARRELDNLIKCRVDLLNAAQAITKMQEEIDRAEKVIMELRDKPFTAAYTHNADKWLEEIHKPPEGMGSFDAAYPVSMLPDEEIKNGCNR